MLTNKKLGLLILFTALSSGLLLISNLAAVKLWNLFGVAVDGGLICFPLTYILGDLIIEFFGEKSAKNIIWSSFITNLLAVLVFWAVIALPVYHGWENQDALTAILGFTPRIIAGSLIAFIASNFINNHIFLKLKSSKSKFGKSFILRALSSSAVAHIFDSLIFETIAFLGVLPFNEFLLQASFAYILGIAVEFILSPIESLIEKKLKRYLES